MYVWLAIYIMLRKLIISVSFILLTVQGFAQGAEVRALNGESLNVIYRNEATFGFILHSGGLGFNYRRAKHVTAKRKYIMEIDAVNMTSPKEFKASNRSYDTRGYYYGKLNYMFIVRPGIGFQNTLFRKGDRKSVEIRYITMLGASLGILKPVYLEILVTDSLNPISTERYNPALHNQDNIYGRSPFLKGINNLNILPGGYIKLGLSVEYADESSSVKAIETGVIFDVYPKKVPIMAYDQNRQMLVSIYLHFIYGRRWF